MLISGPRTAQSACLRCHLRETLLRLRKQRLPAHLRAAWRTHSTSSVRRQELLVDDDDARRDDHGESYYLKRLQPNGRIVGKPGRRQRSSSEQLRTNSLGKPSEVIVFRDVEEDSDAAKRLRHRLARPEELEELQLEGENSLSAQEIDSAARGGRQSSEEQEVHASIDSVRPSSAILEQEQFDETIKRLLQGYNVKQLARYLIRSLNDQPVPPATIKKASKRSRQITATQWRPGVTPVEQRLSSVSFTKDSVGTGKAKVADQILRLAWGVSVHAEEQQLGELELRCRGWMLTWLFDVEHEGRSNYQRYVASPLLARTSEVRLYRPDKIIRITARRWDAEELSQLIQAQLLRVGRLEIDLEGFKSLAPDPSQRDRVSQLFRDQDISEIAKRTNTVALIDSQAKLLNIYGLEEHQRLDAQRLLLSMLDLPAPRTRLAIDAPGAHVDKAAELVKYPATTVHRRYRETELSRFMEPQRAGITQAIPATIDTATAIRLVKHLVDDDLGSMQLTDGLTDPQWTLRVDEWAASFTTILNSTESKSETGIAGRGGNTRVPNRVWKGNRLELYQPPGLGILLTYFEPESKSDARHTVLDAHFRPSPFGPCKLEALRYLPDVRARFHLQPHHSHTSFHGGVMRFYLRETCLDLRAPAQATDLVFSRQAYITGDHAAVADRCNLDEIRTSLRNSIQSGSGTLHLQDSILRMKHLGSIIPALDAAWTKKAKEIANTQDDQVFLLDRIEQVHHSRFEPVRGSELVKRMAPAVREIFENWPDGLIMTVKEVDAGAFGARHLDLMLMWRRLPGYQPKMGDAEKWRKIRTSEPEEICSKLVETASGVLRLLTMANCGQLEPFAAADSVRPPDRSRHQEWRQVRLETGTV